MGLTRISARCYAPTWGRFRDRTRPAPGNHEYHSDGASGYARYFGAAAGDPKKAYYSYDLGTWHVIALNSECAEVGGCDATSPQGQWLKQDLEQHKNGCIVAYFHKPLFSSGGSHGNDPKMKPLWDALYHAGADIVINGHDHDYERFAPAGSGREIRSQSMVFVSSWSAAGKEFTPQNGCDKTKQRSAK